MVHYPVKGQDGVWRNVPSHIEECTDRILLTHVEQRRIQQWLDDNNLSGDKIPYIRGLTPKRWRKATKKGQTNGTS